MTLAPLPLSKAVTIDFKLFGTVMTSHPFLYGYATLSKLFTFHCCELHLDIVKKNFSLIEFLGGTVHKSKQK
jgi:hypothetical protein